MKRRRGSGDGSIRQRPNGLWEAQLRYTDPLSGLRTRTSFYGPTRADVVTKLDDARSRLRKRRAPRDESIALSAFLAHWLEDVVKPTRRRSTYQTYAYTLEHHVPAALAALPLRDLQPIVIARAMVSNVEPTRSAQLALALVKRALDQAVTYGFLTSNPAAGIAGVRPASRELRVLSVDQARRFLELARTDRLYALYALALDTGMRRGELLALRWSDVDLEAGSIHVVRSFDANNRTIGPLKTRSSRRHIAIGASICRILSQHRSRNGTHTLVFASPDGNPLRPHDVRRHSFLPLQAAAGIDPPIRFHDLRHTAATLLLHAGVHPKVVSERLGHASIAITMDTYQHVAPTLQRDAADAISQLLQPSQGGAAGGTRFHGKRQKAR